jgi:hypothetical protein
MMTAATSPGGSGPNEDWYACLPDAVVVLDGVTVKPGMDQGCVHGTPWYVSQLGTAIVRRMTPGRPLTVAVASAIAEVAAMHCGTCDLRTVGAPSAALAVVRLGRDAVEWLVLADVSVAIETSGIEVVSDNRVDASVAGLGAATPDLAARISAARAQHRNRPGGYWVAADDSDAAHHALTGSAPLSAVRRVMVATDGAARLADLFGRSWDYVLDAGPEAVIREVRVMEGADPDAVTWPRIKYADDATAVEWRLTGV